MREQDRLLNLYQAIQNTEAEKVDIMRKWYELKKDQWNEEKRIMNERWELEKQTMLSKLNN